MSGKFKFGIFIWILLPLVVALGFGYAQKVSAMDPLHERAQKIFHFDRAHGHILPQHHVRALSLAIAFDNRDGAEQILSKLEPLAKTL